jgi:hypothetical protein
MRRLCSLINDLKPGTQKLIFPGFALSDKGTKSTLGYEPF